MCGVAGFKGGVTFLAFSARTRRTIHAGAALEATPRRQAKRPRGCASLKIHKNNQCKNATQISAPTLSKLLPPQVISLYLLSQIIVFQADRRSAGHPSTYANMQYTALNRWKKNLAILSHC
jgi:hypothetical protein